MLLEKSKLFSKEYKETIQEALAELKVKQREIEVENAQQHVSKEKKEYIETVMEEKPKEEIVKIKEPLQEPSRYIGF